MQLVTSVGRRIAWLAQAGSSTATSHTHWASSLSEAVSAVKVARGFRASSSDRNRVTGRGVSSALDRALKLVELIAG